MRALCLVAHPDDCVIFGYRFIERHPQFDWHIIYMTYTAKQPRSIEMASFWQKRNVSTDNVGFTDDFSDLQTKHCGWHPEVTKMAIELLTKGYDLILTHNAEGEYNHPHHLAIHEAVKDIVIPKVYFGTYPHLSNHVECLDEAPFDTAEFELHRKVIELFDLKTWKYLITPEAENLLQSLYERS